MNLTRQECSVLKGYAILCIVLHNLWHLMGFASENEFNYSLDRELAFWRCMSEFSSDTFAHLLSYWGWHGVSLFIFLSGYGLVRKYEDSGVVVRRMDFITHHFLKLLVLMVPAFSLYLFLFWLKGGAIWIRPALAQLLMLINVIYHPSVINPGVYWFLGLTLQFYVFYRIFIYRKSNLVLYLFASISLITIILALYLWGGENALIVEYIRHNSIGWIYVFLGGVWFARRDTAGRCNWFLWSLLLLLFVLGGLNAYTWIFTPLLLVLIAVKLVHSVMGVSWLVKIGLWLGHISASLFVIHPLVRMFFYDRGFSYGSSLLYLLISCLLAFFYQKLYKVLMARVKWGK